MRAFFPSIGHTVMTTNNGYDAILLVDVNDRVLSAWTATPESVRVFVQDGAKADEWAADGWDGFDDPSTTHNEDELRTIAAYGVECGRDGAITDDSRRRFWFGDEIA